MAETFSLEDAYTSKDAAPKVAQPASKTFTLEEAFNPPSPEGQSQGMADLNKIQPNVAKPEADAGQKGALPFPLNAAKSAYDSYQGLKETAASVVSGMVAAPVAGIAGIADTLVRGSDKGAQTVAKVQNALTYEPKTEQGKKTLDFISTPLNKVAELGEKAGSKTLEATGSPSMATAVDTAIQSLPMIAGKGLKALPPMLRKVLPDAAKALDTKYAAESAERAKQASLDSTKKGNVKSAIDAGYSLTPADAFGGTLTRMLQKFSGTKELERVLAKKNVDVTNDFARKDIGIPENQPITRAAIASARKEAGQYYEKIKSVGAITNDEKFTTDLAKATSKYDEAAKSYKKTVSPIKDLIEEVNLPEVDASAAIAKVSILRDEANTHYASGDKSLGKAKIQVADAIDDAIARHLDRLAQKSNSLELKSMVSDYKAARTRIAKTYLADKALNETTGNINPMTYGSALAKGQKLDGGALRIAEFQRAFPSVAKKMETIGATTGPTVTDLITSAIVKRAAVSATATGAAYQYGGATGAMIVGAGTLARPALRAGLASKVVQNSIKSPSSEAGLIKGAGAALSKSSGAVGVGLTADEIRARERVRRRQQE